MTLIAVILILQKRETEAQGTMKSARGHPQVIESSFAPSKWVPGLECFVTVLCGSRGEAVRHDTV